MPGILGKHPADMSSNRSDKAVHIQALQVHASRYIGAVKNRFSPPLRRCVPAVLAGALCVAAHAAPSSAVPAPAIADGLALLKQAAQSLAPDQARIEVSIGAPDSRLTLAPCAVAQAYLGTGAKAWGRTRLGVRCTEGGRWNIQLPATVQIWAPAVVANSALSAGAPLSVDQLSVAEVDWGLHAAPRSADMSGETTSALQADAGELQGRLLARPVMPGAPVRTLDLQSRRWFAAGAKVTISAVGEGFAIASEGQALSAGLEGQWVRVRTESGRVVSGKAVAENRVEIRL